MGKAPVASPLGPLPEPQGASKQLRRGEGARHLPQATRLVPPLGLVPDLGRFGLGGCADPLAGAPGQPQAALSSQAKGPPRHAAPLPWALHPQAAALSRVRRRLGQALPHILSRTQARNRARSGARRGARREVGSWGEVAQRTRQVPRRKGAAGRGADRAASEIVSAGAQPGRRQGIKGRRRKEGRKEGR